ncbi:hypothetical protein JTB14_029227 [Gonioctena quinquepunctata]|nr:hypothetical protein JTB14_029227 [Gonioctena quinquepunctata]
MFHSKMGARRCFLSEKQKTALINFMEMEPELLKARFTSEFTHELAKDKWIAIASHLNCLPGAYKDWIQWRRTWQDIKKQVKKKRSLLPDVSLTKDDEKLLSLLENCGGDNRELKKLDFNTPVDLLEEQPKHETIYVEYVNSQTDAEEVKPTDDIQKETEAEDSAETGIEAEEYLEYSNLNNRTFKRKRTLSRVEKEYRLREMYCREKLLITKRYYQERLKIERENARSRHRIASALEKIATQPISKDIRESLPSSFI